jgi:hypothetical protein
MTRYKITCRCLECGHKYSRILETMGRAIEDVPDPPCPKCKTKRKRKHGGLKKIIAEQSAPSITGGNVKVAAIDETARIVMEDYGLSDLKTNTREGDSQVPNLTPRQQKMSANFWGGKRSRRPLSDGKAMVNAAMQGAYLPGRGALAKPGSVSGNEVLQSLHSARTKPKTTIIADATRESLRK